VFKETVDQVANTLSRMAAADDALFDEASADVDNRQLGTLREFFKLLDDEGASLRIVEGDRDFELTAQAVQRARQRAEAMTIEERIEILQGEIIGWAEYSSRFELRLHTDRSVVIGTVSRDAMERSLQEGSVPLHRHVRASIKVREARLRHRMSRKTFTLQSFEPAAVPENWPVRPVQQPI